MPRKTEVTTNTTRGDVTVTMSKVDALALARIADTGLRVTEALGLVQSTAAAERGLRLLNDAATSPSPAAKARRG